MLFFSACEKGQRAQVDELNERSYAYHYRSLDSTRVFAEQALQLSAGYPEGRAEALNNLAFVCIAQMDYTRAYILLDSIKTDNLVELLVADVQYMRLCQRESKNKLFYDYSGRAQRRLHRISEELNRLTDHQRQRLIYAESEFYIVQSTYFYYVGLREQSVDALAHIDPNGQIERDTAQLLNYLYNVGAGGILSEPSPDAVNDGEMDHLLRCYQLALDHNYPFFTAQALQGLSEHLEDTAFCNRYVRENLPAIALLNKDEMADTLLAGNLAQRALGIFEDYGDVYQTAGAYRTLAECYWGIRDYQSAEICLLNALQRDTIINRAPDLVASIREQLSLVYSAIDDKERSDVNRNIYLDMQEQTRQDRQLEARSEQLQSSSQLLNAMIVAVVLMILVVLALLYFFHRKRKREDSQFSIHTLLQPLEEWKQATTSHTQQLAEHDEELREQIVLVGQQVQRNKRRNLEQRAKVSLVNNIMPFIDRIVNEVHRLLQHQESEEVRAERFAYVGELTDKIGDYNRVLTRWIEMRQGEVSLRVESFPLQELFDMVKRGRMSFTLKGVDLQVEDSEAVVKADKTLTLFMINTMADNARKFTQKGGSVTISATTIDDCVEISVADTGVGMSEDQLANVFSRKPVAVQPTANTSASSISSSAPSAESSETTSHGFGLMNCKGIIEKYRKMSKIFSVCSIGAESEQGRGSRFFFRLPKGVVRTLLLLSMLLSWPAASLWAEKGQTQTQPPSTSLNTSQPQSDSVSLDRQQALLTRAAAFADSAYFSNINGTYYRTLHFADSCRQCLNEFYLMAHPQSDVIMTSLGDDADMPAELQWFRDSIPTDYGVIQSIRNETAVAALALHHWELYQYNNKVYTKLFRELSADKTLPSYCQMMQKSETNKNVAIVLLTLLLLSIFPAYYLLYYQHRLAYHYQVERVNGINRILLSQSSAEEKLQKINQLWDQNSKDADQEHRELDVVVSQICEALQQSIDRERSQHTSIELSEDELRRVNYENARLHISNNVLDNCLSTLKHETMYYPSRIRQLIDEEQHDLNAISEVVSYYKDLYTMLSLQAQRQIEAPVRIDNDMLAILFEILSKHGGEQPKAVDKESASRYLQVDVPMPSLQLSAVECQLLFTPLTTNIDFLLCRQIVRELGEATNAHGCGIEALPAASVSDAGQSAGTLIRITLTRQIWNHLKLLS
ncbi:MAG: DUF5112 domain-containing protein [Prevotella sp.]|nr:DUF5112 domain-containing protein [Prevotella sp.]